MQMNLKFVNYIKGPWTTGPTTIKIALTVILQFRHLSVHILSGHSTEMALLEVLTGSSLPLVTKSSWC